MAFGFFMSLNAYLLSLKAQYLFPFTIGRNLYLSFD